MPSGIDYRAIRGYIQKAGFEGPSHRIGQVPTDDEGNVIGKSGVTIGVGFDLGQHNEHDLKKMGFSEGMRNKLKPYLRLKGQAAIDANSGTNKLVLGQEDYLQVIMRPTKYYTDILASKYDESTGVAGDFESLDPAIQGTLFSVSYQYGMDNPAKTTPKFWKHATSKDWEGLVNELKTGNWGKNEKGTKEGLDYIYNRRTLEASKLEESGVLTKQKVFDQELDIGAYSN
tara:strand:+ start:26 stop:712 length:687 start_codon:yes stop_codon:yes gene_type:complete